MNLRQLLTPERVQVRVAVDSWEEAVQRVGRLLVSTGGVQERYIQAMIRTVQELGPYIVIAPGIAIPHARPEDGVLSPCMAMITLDPPTPFGNPDNDPVRVVLAFAAADKHQHLQALREMAQILSDKDKVAALTQAKEPGDILRVMWSLSQQNP
jgi:mannitol/fructose-specific phosphotransferase system IIA component (Ntr-type)